MTDLIVSAAASAALVADQDLARNLIEGALSPATVRAYRSDWKMFTAWCSARGVVAMPALPETIAAFIGAEVASAIRASTLTRRIAAIAFAHKAAGHISPTASAIVAQALKGARRALGTAQERKSPATADRVAKMIATLPDTLAGKRNRAILTLGFGGAFRRSELVALTVADLVEVEGGARVTIRRSKTDQTGAGQEIGVLNGVHLRPLDAVREWCEAAGITEGPIFRRVLKGGRIAGPLDAESVADIVKAAAIAAGLDPTQFSGHSLRAGFITSGAEAGVDALKLSEVSRHRSLDVLRGYVRRANLLKDHAGRSFM